jgi:hypothetical protein
MMTSFPTSFHENLTQLTTNWINPAHVIDTFECKICLERHALGEMIQFPKCLHTFCITCATMGIEKDINQNMVPVACFEFNGEKGKKCGVPIDLEFIIQHDLVAKDILDMYQRRLVLADPTKAECPNPLCHAIVTQTQMTSDGHPHPDVECVSCHQIFCLVHSASHNNQTCSDYLRAQKDNKQNLQLMDCDAKTCPNVDCKAIITKTGGCNHMTCTQCHTNFCWLCLVQIDNSEQPQHFQDGICPQFGDRPLTPCERFIHVYLIKLLKCLLWILVLFPTYLMSNIIGMVCGMVVGVLWNGMSWMCRCREGPSVMWVISQCSYFCGFPILVIVSLPWCLLFLGVVACVLVCDSSCRSEYTCEDGFVSEDEQEDIV